MNANKKKIPVRPLRDPDRLRWPPGRSDIAAAVALVALLAFLVANQWPFALASLLIGVAAFLWPTAEHAKATIGPDGTLHLEAQRVEADYVVVDDPDDEEPTRA